MRGAPLVIHISTELERIIPADAGSTSYIEMTLQNGRDHPRGCGEHANLRIGKSRSRGSSPRMRGARFSKPSCAYDERIIPADAGSTLKFTADQLWFEDHPRGCGEHVLNILILMVKRGSSPRMRGARWRLPTVSTSQRIIPADAGSTLRNFP